MNPSKHSEDIFPIEEETEENDDQENDQEEEEEEEGSKIEEEEKELSEEELEIKLKENPNSLETIILLLEAYKTNKKQDKLNHLRQDAHKSFMLPESFFKEKS